PLARDGAVRLTGSCNIARLFRPRLRSSAGCARASSVRTRATMVNKPVAQSHPGARGASALYGAQSDHPIAFIASHATCRCESALAAHQLDELLQLALVQI